MAEKTNVGMSMLQVRMYAWAIIYGGLAVAHVARPPLFTSLIDPKEQRNCYS